jgi:putative serine protease PepD
MDQTTRQDHEVDSGGDTGWSAPTTPGAGPLPRRDPWTTRPNDTGPVPRPTDTRAFNPNGPEDDPAHARASDYQTPVSGPGPDYGTVPPGQPSGIDTGVAPATATRRSRKGTALIAVLALGAGLIGGAAGSAVYDALSDDTAPVVSSLGGGSATGGDGTAAFASVSDVADQVLPSVVSIAVGPGGGTGVIISSDGHILTNNHVAAAAQGGGLRVTFHDGSTADAEVVGLDPVTDLAVIRVQGVSDLQPAALGSSAELRVGDQVVAVGSPLGLDGTVTSGIVSALNRPVTAGDRTGGQTSTFGGIQTDAPINPGNSGGPLVDMSGQVVGINSAIATIPGSEGSIGLGFAIPIDQARIVAEQLIETGSATHARLEIGVNDAQGDTAGALVAEVTAGGAGAGAGLEEGDVITQINDLQVTDAESLIAAVRSYRPGDEVTLTVIRGGETMEVAVTLGSSAPST